MDHSPAPPPSGRAAAHSAGYGASGFRYRILGPDDTTTEDHALLRHALQVSRVGFWQWDEASRCLTISAELLDLYGATPESAAAGPRALNEFVHPDDRAAVEDAIDSLVRGGGPVEIMYRVLRGGKGTPAWFTARASSTGTTPAVLTCTVIETDDLGSAEAQLRAAHVELLQANHRQLAVIATTPDAIHIYDVASGDLHRANADGAPLTGFSAEAARVLQGQDLTDLIPRGDLSRLQDTLRRARSLRDAEVIGLRHQVLSADGSVSWLSRRISPLSRHADGSVRELVVVSRDATGEVTATERLRHAASHDELTGLANRRFLMQTLSERLAEPGGDQRYAVLLCDLDGFKQINDSRGHAAGDEVLRQAAARLRHATRDGDIIGRLGGDEFVLLLVIPPDAEVDAVVGRVAERIVTSLSQPIRHSDMLLTIGVSIGVSLPEPGETADSAVAAADEAMYRAKGRGGNRHVLAMPTG